MMILKAMRIFVFVLCCFSVLADFGQTSYVMAEPQKIQRSSSNEDSVLYKGRFTKNFDEISVLHNGKESLHGLKQTAPWEVREYVLRQADIFRRMKHNMLKRISVGTLQKALDYKFSFIICKLSIWPHNGIVRKVSFLINHEISTDFTNEDILELENIILNTQFVPDSSINGDFLLCYCAIDRNTIKDFLNSNK